jgi:serine/threonine-protein kinase
MMSREGASSPFSAGAVIAKKYRLIQRLGDGSMGVVWHARHEPTGADCALKLVVRPSPDLRVRLLCEAQACSELVHDNIVRVHEIGETGSGDPFLVMDLLRGETLADLLARRKRLEVPEAARIGRDIARALEYAHAKGMIHRDLRPANVFLDEGPGRTQPPIVKVLDFGVSKNLLAASMGRTVATATLGSPAYMSPEQALAQTDIDGRTDVWSLGVMLFEMLSGGRPFEGEPLEVMQKVVSGPIPLLWHKVRYIHPGLSGMVMSCLRRNREDRPWPVAEIVRRLDTFASPMGRRSVPAALPPPNPPPRKVSPESITTPRIERRRAVPPPLPLTAADATLAHLASLGLRGPSVLPAEIGAHHRPSSPAGAETRASVLPFADTDKQALSAPPAEPSAETGAQAPVGAGSDASSSAHAPNAETPVEAGAQAPFTEPANTPSMAEMETPRIPPEEAALLALRGAPEGPVSPAAEPPGRASQPAAPTSHPAAPTSRPTARTSLPADSASLAVSGPDSSKPASSARRAAPAQVPQATKTPLSAPSPVRAPAVDLASLVRAAEASPEKPSHHLHRGATIAAAAIVTIAVFAVAMFAVEGSDRSGAGSEAMCPVTAASVAPAAPGRVPADASLPQDSGPSPDRAGPGAAIAPDRSAPHAAPSMSPPAPPSASMTPATPGSLAPSRSRSRFPSALTPPPGWTGPGRSHTPAPRF